MDAYDGTVASMVLFLEDRDLAPNLKSFCDEHHLLAIMGQRKPAGEQLREFSDLGGILLSEHYAGSLKQTADVARELHALRPEIPIILRRKRTKSTSGLPAELRSICSAAYVADELDSLKKAIDTHIFTLHYPPALIRGIGEIAERALHAEFDAFSVSPATPLIVHNQVAIGEVFSLIPLQSNWCRGYLMVQICDSNMPELMKQGADAAASASFDALKDRLREATNLIWGCFKNRYVGDHDLVSAYNIQIPLVFSLREKSVSFGARNAHLCLRYKLKDEASQSSFWIYLRFVFNLTWVPDAFCELVSTSDASPAVAAGAVEYF